jgi:hypothetical protein
MTENDEQKEQTTEGEESCQEETSDRPKEASKNSFQLSPGLTRASPRLQVDVNAGWLLSEHRPSERCSP